MLKKLREKWNILRTHNNSSSQAGTDAGPEGADVRSDVQRVGKVVRRQAILAIITLAVVAVTIFAMTSAWYTNVSKVSTLKFTTEVWGFDPGEITVSTEVINAAPGRGGIVPLTVDNTGKADGVKISVSVNKTSMGNTELRRRIFFYADAPIQRSGETMARSYIGSTDMSAWSYVVPAGQKLVLGNGYCSDVPIRWEWVYDMLGYYFLGTVDGTAPKIDEYLSPIEYDLDNAVFDITGDGATGRLLGVNGVAVGDFLASISAVDGYPGTISTAEGGYVAYADGKVFYKVAVNESGYGVWAYLCTYGEIEQGIKFDTETAGTLGDFSVTLTLSAVNLPVRSVSVSTESDIRSAISGESDAALELAGNVDVSAPIILDGDTSALIDLNGYTVKCVGTAGDFDAFKVRDGASLTVMNGDIVGNGQYSASAAVTNSAAFRVSLGDLTMSGVNVSGFDSAVYVQDSAGTSADSVVRLYGCDLESPSTTVFFMGNGSASAANSKLIVNDCVINSTGYVGISGQGSTDRWGTDIAISGSTVSGYYAALYQPQQKSSTLITDCRMTGMTGVVIKGGTLDVVRSQVTGTGAYVPAARNGGGWTDTGDGIYMEAVYNWNASVRVDGESTVTSANSYGIELFGADGYGVGTVIVDGGTYTGGQGSANWNGIGSFVINGGTFEGYVSDNITRNDLGG